MEESTKMENLDQFLQDINILFTNTEKSIKLLQTIGCIPQDISCDSCVEAVMKLKKDSSKPNGVFWKCEDFYCNKKKNFYYVFKNKLPKIKINKILQCAYYYSLKMTNYQVKILTGISEMTYIELKKIFVKSLLFGMGSQSKLGGENFTIQVDETACNRRRLIVSPTSEEEFIRDTKWVIGLICEETGEIRLGVLEDRTVGSIKLFLDANVISGTVIKTDGYPTYPRAISEINCIHRVVNHTLGFVSSDGTHTNSIENVWAHLKTDIRTRRGVMYKNLSSLIVEWTLYHNLVKRKNKENIDSFFLKMINNL